MSISNLVRVARENFDKGESLVLCGDLTRAVQYFDKAANYYDKLLSIAPYKCEADAAHICRIRAALARKGVA